MFDEPSEPLRAQHLDASLSAIGLSIFELESDGTLRHVIGAPRWIHDLQGLRTLEDLERLLDPHHRGLIASQLAAGETQPLYVKLDDAEAKTWLSVSIVPAPTRHGARLILQPAPNHAELLEARLENRRQANVIDGPNLGTWEWNIKTGETKFNERWAEIIGYSLAELEPTDIDTWVRFTHVDDLARSNALLQAHWSGETIMYECECRMRHRNGRWVWVHDRGRVIRWSSDGEPLLMAGTHEDISALKRSEREREDLRRQLIQAQRLESVGRLAGGIAHDFNNMLSVVVGNADLLLTEISSASPQRTRVESILDASGKATALTRQLLTFSRSQPSQPQPIDVDVQVRASLELFQRLFSSGVKVTLESSPELPCALIDPSQFDQILSNLIVNARDAVEGFGVVHVRLGEQGGYVMLEVTDDGPGIPDPIRDQIFDPFFTTKGAGKGTGLGLSTVHGLVLQNNGHIEVRSEEGRGASFRILLPSTTLSATSSQPRESYVSSPNAAHILVIEDEPMVKELICEMLEREAYIVTSFTSPAEALMWCETNGPPRLILSDVVMPDMTGPELVQKIRQRWPQLPALLMSGYSNSERWTGLPTQHPLLEKPFTRKELSTAVRKCLAAPEALSRPSEISNGDLNTAHR